MKKILIIFVLFLISLNSAYGIVLKINKKKNKKLPNDVMAPALQFNNEDYKNYFKKSTDYKIYLKSYSDYKITCDKEIIGINFGDKTNIKINDKKNKNGELKDMKSTIIELKKETYTYLRLYKVTGEVVNIVLNVNPAFEEKQNINLGLCKIEAYRE